MKRVAVTGATGTIGRAVCAALQARGDRVQAWVRDEAAARSVLGAEVETERFDLTGGSIGSAALARCDAVVNLAGRSIFRPFSGRGYLQRVTRERVEGTHRLAACIARLEPGPKVLVQASSVGVYGFGSPDGREVTERSEPLEGIHAHGSRAWEHAAEVAGVRTVYLRLGYVLSRSGGGLAHQWARFEGGRAAYFAPGEQWLPWVHLEDVVRFVLHAIDTPDAGGPYNVVAPDIVCARDFAATLADVVGVSPVRSSPRWMARLFVGAGADVLLSGRRVVSTRLSEEGFGFAHPELREALEWERNS